MHKGAISLVPVLTVFFSLAAFLSVVYLALPQPELVKNSLQKYRIDTDNLNIDSNDVADNTNLATNESRNSPPNENQNLPTVVNENIEVDVTKNWKTYTDAKYGFSFRYPEEWTITETPAAYLGVSYDAVQVVDTESETAVPQFAVTAFPMKYDQTDPFTNFTLSTNIIQSTATKSDITIAGIYGKFFKGFPTLEPANAAFIDHNTITFKLDQGNAEVWEDVLKTFAFTDKNADIDADDPIKSVLEISGLLNWSVEGGIRHVSIMGDTALIAGNEHLSYYDGKNFTDISEKVPRAESSGRMLVGYITNNGSYWLVPVIFVGGKSYLYRYDGRNWIDLSSALDAAVPRTVSAGSSSTWNGSYWLMTVHAGKVAKYDGQIFTDLTSQVPTIGETGSLGVPVWNGSYFLFSGIASGNHGKFYRYDGNMFSVISGLGVDSYAMSAGWNGSYWLFSGFNNQHLLKYNGSTFTDLGFPQHQGSSATWIKSKWLVGPNFFDGKNMDTTTPFNIGYRVNSVSVGEKYGLMLGENGTVYRFDL